MGTHIGLMGMFHHFFFFWLTPSRVMDLFVRHFWYFRQKKKKKNGNSLRNFLNFAPLLFAPEKSLFFSRKYCDCDYFRVHSSCTTHPNSMKKRVPPTSPIFFPAMCIFKVMGSPRRVQKWPFWSILFFWSFVAVGGYFSRYFSRNVKIITQTCVDQFFFWDIDRVVMV
jgi:hypothetical protein